MMLSAYLLLAAGKFTARSNTYHWLNVLSGAGFVINSGWNGAYPSAFINVVWAAIGACLAERGKIRRKTYEHVNRRRQGLSAPI